MSRKLTSDTTLDNLRKEAKRWLKALRENDPHAGRRLETAYPNGSREPVLRDVQHALAREYGFEGWQDLRAAALRLEDKSPEWAAAEAERAIHDNEVERLAQLIREYPALLSWRGNSGESLLGFATGSFGDSGDPNREKMFTRIECAEFLLDAGATVEPAIWEGAIRARAEGVLQLLLRKGVPPRRLDILAALGDYEGVRDCLESIRTRPGGDAAAVTQAFLRACRFKHKPVAALLLNRSIELDPALGERVEKWRGQSGFIDYLAEHQVHYGGPWQTVVRNEIQAAMDANDLDEFSRWLQRESDLLDEHNVVELIENAAYHDREPFIARLMEFHPALKVKRPPSFALGFALEYGNAHLIPLLTQIWPLPDDLPHAAGVGDFAGVRGWFDEAGRPRLGSLSQHYPTNNPSVLRNLHWAPPNAQHILDVALAWACMNRQLEIADFLLGHGANINTDWGTHEPASILHECAIRGNYEAAQFLIDRGIDMTICDYRWDGTAEGWAYYAAKDKDMAEFLARAERARKAQSL
ncbi:MAG: ankyrin repeat domain-containing protein [Bryobacteraceae bacterium]|jgi:hypothetical protein